MGNYVPLPIWKKFFTPEMMGVTKRLDPYMELS